ncbi:hypothetical protein [Agromyces sp. ZXT2-6]|uniref:hypothetical protein n=1 Tax=Agromyces sp. ZXT2-6 TaxID=3461153 RepID=UPI004054D1F5
MTSRGARAIRGAAIAVFATLVASLAHSVGGGTPPGVLAIALSLAFSVPLAMALSGERMSLVRASAAALFAQAALHLLYALGTPSPGPAASVAGHASHGTTAPIRIDAIGLAAVIDHGHAVTMPVAHVAAAALTVAMLAVVGNAAAAVAVAFGTAVRGLRLLAGAIGASPVATAVRHVVPAARRHGPPDLALVLLSSLRHRGPPASSLAA